MKKQYLLLLIIPICFIFFSIGLRLTEGPYYNDNADPSYVYLINSLSLAQMKSYSIGHVDHPGTPLQITGAIIIKIFYTFNHEKNDLPEDVLYRPETYLNVIDFTLIFLNSLGLYLMGLIIYNVKKNIIISLFFQTIPFISINISEVFPLVKPENFIFFILAIFISFVIKFIYEENIPSKNIFFYAIGAGILFGFILATKISFVCLILIPLILIPGISKKIIFLLTTFFSFIIFVLPAISNVSYFINWVGRLIFYTERYGHGSPSIINLQSFFTNINKIFINERFFTIVYFLIIAVLIFLIIKDKRKNFQEGNSKELKLLIAIFLSMSLQIVLVAKHYSHRYMFPALILSIPGLYIAISILYKKYLYKINANIIFGIIFILIFFFSAYNSRKIFSRAKSRTIEMTKLNNYMQTHYTDAKVILSSGTTNEFVGLILGFFYSGESVKQNYKLYINTRFHNQPWYDIFNNKLYSISDSFDVKNIFQSGKPILFQTRDETYNNNFVENLKTDYHLEDVRLSKVFSNGNGELLYELIFNGNEFK